MFRGDPDAEAEWSVIGGLLAPGRGGRPSPRGVTGVFSMGCCMCCGPGNAPARHPDRALVAGRGAGRPEERDHPSLGASRNPAFGAKGPAHGIRLY